MTLYHVIVFKNWSQHRKDEVRFLPKNIDATLCTHAYFAFANIDTDKYKLATFEKNDISDSPELPVNINDQYNFINNQFLNNRFNRLA